MSETGWGIIFVLGSTLAGTALIGVLVWQIFKTQQTKLTTRAEIAHEEAYRTLAEQMTAAQQRTADELSALSNNISELRGRVAAIEKLLSEVG